MECFGISHKILLNEENIETYGGSLKTAKELQTKNTKIPVEGMLPQGFLCLRGRMQDLLNFCQQLFFYRRF